MTPNASILFIHSESGSFMWSGEDVGMEYLDAWSTCEALCSWSTGSVRKKILIDSKSTIICTHVETGIMDLGCCSFG